MYKLNEFIVTSSNCNKKSTFFNLWTSKWDKLHEDTGVFRYKINNLEKQEQIVDEKYLIMLNPDRQSKRRIPEDINSIYQPFDAKKFNFTKVSPKEILFSLEGPDSDMHTFLVNVSPISKYHALLCPSINKCLPQVITKESLDLAIEVLFVAGDCDLKIGFNSLCAFASVNHLHFHLLVEKNTLPVEKVKWRHIKNHLHILDEEYPVPAFCFKIPKQCKEQISKDIYRLLAYFLEKSIAHNVLLIKGRSETEDDAVHVVVYPRKSTKGVKQLEVFNVAVLELSGWVTVYGADDFNNLKTQDIENELKKWKIDNFHELCGEVQNLY